MWLASLYPQPTFSKEDVNSRGPILQFLAKETLSWVLVSLMTTASSPWQRAAVKLQLMNCATDKWRPWAFRFNATLVRASRCSHLRFVVPEFEAKNTENREEAYSTWYLSCSGHPPCRQNHTSKYSSRLMYIQLADTLLLVLYVWCPTVPYC